MSTTAASKNGRREATGDGVQGTDFVARARLQILRELQREGTRAVPELPHRWPITRPHLAHLVSLLAEEGLVEYLASGGPPAPRVRLTAAGQRLAAALEASPIPPAP